MSISIPQTSSPCPCGSGSLFMECCGACLQHGHAADTAEALMRSRYTAYVLRDDAYLLRTWHGDTRPARLALQNDSEIQWQGLEVRLSRKGSSTDNNGIVEFIARYIAQGKTQQLHERSRFVREHGQWYYLDGVTPSAAASAQNVGRNDPCSCGSGIKYKRCCGQ